MYASLEQSIKFQSEVPSFMLTDSSQQPRSQSRRQHEPDEEEPHRQANGEQKAQIQLTYEAPTRRLHKKILHKKSTVRQIVVSDGCVSDCKEIYEKNYTEDKEESYEDDIRDSKDDNEEYDHHKKPKKKVKSSVHM